MMMRGRESIVCRVQYTTLRELNRIRCTVSCLECGLSGVQYSVYSIVSTVYIRGVVMIEATYNPWGNRRGLEYFIWICSRDLSDLPCSLCAICASQFNTISDNLWMFRSAVLQTLHHSVCDTCTAWWSKALIFPLARLAACRPLQEQSETKFDMTTKTGAKTIFLFLERKWREGSPCRNAPSLAILS